MDSRLIDRDPTNYKLPQKPWCARALSNSTQIAPQGAKQDVLPSKISSALLFEISPKS